MTSMPWENPTFEIGKVVFGLPYPLSRRPDLDDLFIRAVRDAFPVVANRQTLAPDAPAQIPHLHLQSTASRLAVSAVGAELEARFYGDYVTDYARCREYLRSKASSVIQAWMSTGEVLPSFVGVILSANYSTQADGINPVVHLLATHMRVNAPGDATQDAMVRVGVRLSDRYFVTITLSNYESKLVDRPIFPGQLLQVKPWEGSIADVGISAQFDINNRLEAISQRRDPRVNAEELNSIFDVLDRTVASNRRYIEAGDFNLVGQAAG